MRYAVKKCEYDKEYTLQKFHTVKAAIKYVRRYDPSGIVPLIVFDNESNEVVNWTASARAHTFAYLRRKVGVSKVNWAKEGF